MSKGNTPEFLKGRPMHIAGAMSGAGDAAASQIKETLAMMYSAIEKGIEPKKMLSVGDDTVEGLYSQAYTLYNTGKYNEAQYLFVILMMLNPNEPKHVLGSAACLHRLGKYDKAAQIYVLASALDKDNPLPNFHAADCYIKMKALPLADMCLRNAIKSCGDKKEFSVVRDRATLMLKAVDDEIQALGGFPGIDPESAP